jgi:hypothetical protein
MLEGGVVREIPFDVDMKAMCGDAGTVEVNFHEMRYAQLF